MGEDGENLAPVRLEQRAHTTPVAGRLDEQLDRVRVEPGRERGEDVLAGRVDEVGPLRRHRGARLPIASAGTPPYEATADNAACRCSLSQRSASSAAAQPEPAAVTAWR